MSQSSVGGVVTPAASTPAFAPAPAPAAPTSTHFTPSTSFRFPREYSFPPFFTVQPNLATRHAQFAKWFALIRAYCRHHRIYRLSAANPAASGAPDLFRNPRLDRALDPPAVREVLEAMRRDPGGHAEPVSSPGSPDEPDAYWIYWRTPAEWAALLEGWIAETAQQGSVLTLYEITEGEATRSTGTLPHPSR